MALFKAARLREIPPGNRLLVDIHGIETLLFNIDGEIYATGNYCPHEEIELDRASLNGHILICWEHGYELRVDTGECLTDCSLKLPTFPVIVKEGYVYVEL